MTEFSKHHCSKRIQAWTSAFLLALAIIAGLIWKTGPVYAAPASDGRAPYTLHFVDQDGNPFLKSDIADSPFAFTDFTLQFNWRAGIRVRY